MPAEVFRSIFSEAIGPQRQLPLHNKWTDSRLRLAQRQELQRCTNLRLYLGANRAIRKTAIDIHYWKAPFVFYNLDELKHYIESMPTEAKSYPISIEVGLLGKSPAKTWALAESINIHHLTLVIHKNTSMNIPKQHINDLEFLHG